MCHDLDKYNKKSYTHPLGIGCDACHSYHEPDKSGAFLKRDPIESCLKCHSQLKAARTHPMRVKDPNTGGELTCTSSCHRIHGADYRNLCSMEPGRQLCISCHDNLR
jgi:predicted CXXCH cytochrome family protein